MSFEKATWKKWNEIPGETTRNLVRSMPRRVEAVIKINGRITK